MVLPMRVRVHLGVMAIKEYSTPIKASEMELNPLHLTQFSATPAPTIFL